MLKTLSFIYNQTVLFHGAFREKLVTEILLKGFFFRLFLHWMHEIRRYFLHILVFKIFRTSRKMLPCNIDKALLDQGWCYTWMNDATPSHSVSGVVVCLLR